MRLIIVTQLTTIQIMRSFARHAKRHGLPLLQLLEE